MRSGRVCSFWAATKSLSWMPRRSLPCRRIRKQTRQRLIQPATHVRHWATGIQTHLHVIKPICIYTMYRYIYIYIIYRIYIYVIYIYYIIYIYIYIIYIYIDVCRDLYWFTMVMGSRPIPTFGGELTMVLSKLPQPLWSSWSKTCYFHALAIDYQWK